jgi:hypothetical protein
MQGVSRALEHKCFRIVLKNWKKWKKKSKSLQRYIELACRVYLKNQRINYKSRNNNKFKEWSFNKRWRFEINERIVSGLKQ